MSSYSIPKPLFRAVHVQSSPSARRETVATEGRSMIKMFGRVVTILAVCVLTWQLTVAEPYLPRLLSSLVLMLISILAGIGIGAGGAANYIRDVHRLNKVLAEQHRELEELNSNMLKQLSAEIEMPASSDKS